MKKTALVTGGAGFIGSHLCESLLKKGYKVICYDNLYSGSESNLEGIIKDPNFTFIKADVLDTKKLSESVNKADIIFHLAAILGVSKVVEEPLLTMTVNIKGVENICEAALKAKKKPRVLFTSSSEAYGKNSKTPLKESDDLLYGPTYITRWNYGMSKAIGEHILWSYSKSGLPVTIVRLFNCYGPRGLNSTYSHVIPKFIKCALKGEDLPVNKDGKQTRTFCFVTDTVEGIIKASQYLPNEIVNIGASKETKVLDLAKIIIKNTKSTSKIKFVPESVMYGKNFESVLRRRPDTKKASTKAHFKARISLDEGVKKTISWMRPRI